MHETFFAGLVGPGIFWGIRGRGIQPSTARKTVAWKGLLRGKFWNCKKRAEDGRPASINPIPSKSSKNAFLHKWIAFWKNAHDTRKWRLNSHVSQKRRLSLEKSFIPGNVYCGMLNWAFRWKCFFCPFVVCTGFGGGVCTRLPSSWACCPVFCSLSRHCRCFLFWENQIIFYQSRISYPWIFEPAFCSSFPPGFSRGIGRRNWHWLFAGDLGAFFLGVKGPIGGEMERCFLD